MGAQRTALLVLSAELLAAPFAYADNAGPLGPMPLPAQNVPNRAASHLDYLNNSFFAVREKSAGAESAFHHEAEAAQSKPAEPNGVPATGLHWEAGSQRPALEYRFSNQGTMHFHFSRHGTTAAAVWKF